MHIYVRMIYPLASSPVTLFSLGAEGRECLQEVLKFELTVLTKLGFKRIKSVTSVFKRLNISKVISVLNFWDIFILLIGHNAVGFS